MTPLGSWGPGPNDYYSTYDYEDIVKFMRDGFAFRFPFPAPEWTYPWILKTCLKNSRSDFHEQMSSSSIQNKISVIFAIDVRFLGCVKNNSLSDYTKLYWAVLVIVSAISIMKLIIVFAVLSRLVFAPLSVLIFLGYKYWKTKVVIDAVEKFLQMQLALGPTRFAYTDITAITSHFRDKLGQGGYGSVYKGVLPGDIHVAIKMLVSSMSNGEEFISEVSSIGSIHHVNVVRLILHFDIKPHNILLDSDFTPKVADFGLAKLYPRDNSFLPVSAARGTVGYIAPEMVSRSFGAISSKSDVYSFGMLLLEMAGGRRNVDPQASRSQTYYPSWVYNQLSRQEVGGISEVVGIHQVERKLCIVALWCIQMKPDDRPAMSEVLDMLEAGIDGLEMPPEPFFCGDEFAPAADSSVLSEIRRDGMMILPGFHILRTDMKCFAAGAIIIPAKHKRSQSALFAVGSAQILTVDTAGRGHGGSIRGNGRGNLKCQVCSKFRHDALQCRNHFNHVLQSEDHRERSGDAAPLVCTLWT
uniref:Putative receptor-like protein kinase n=1 Tax=Aegilops tauschii TaxID=37682 RepID=N1QW83_AEGTA